MTPSPTYPLGSVLITRKGLPYIVVMVTEVMYWPAGSCAGYEYRLLLLHTDIKNPGKFIYDSWYDDEMIKEKFDLLADGAIISLGET